MVRQKDAGASYDPASAIFDDRAASRRKPWPYALLPKEVLILRRSAVNRVADPLVDLVESAPDPGELTQVSFFAPDDPPRIGRQYPVQQVRSSQALQPPTDAKRRRAYYALLNRAQGVRPTNPRQAALLEARARKMMESVDSGIADRDRRPPVRTAPNPPRMTGQASSETRWAE